eukprot:UN23625
MSILSVCAKASVLGESLCMDFCLRQSLQDKGVSVCISKSLFKTRSVPLPLSTRP